jgi:L-asparaginase / beta-aspartyl-peptidase
MRPVILLHGGAGAMKTMGGEREGRYRTSLRAACAAGASILEAGGTALEAVTQANVFMENSGAFNAGLGSCLTSGGTIEMDAAVMNGADRGVGAVTGIAGVANPVLVARAVMEKTPHCMLQGTGADAFAAEHGFPLRPNFPSSGRLEMWKAKKVELDSHGPWVNLADRLATLGGVAGVEPVPDSLAVGPGDTVGAVAMDRDGHLAAGVTTGGIWMKQLGRVGDSPLPGSGLWAVDGLGASCATGTGEMILKVLLCREVIDRMGTATDGCEAAIELLESQFGTGLAGVIAIDPQGEPGFAFHTNGMGRAMWRDGMEGSAVAVWPEEDWDRAVPR